ncbi:MAG: class I SAM-dependent methyltransferase [Anaerolineae bacterium]|nr:class I SAM-dependent methyltransferase [Anaerolineae bacterium]
MRYLQANRDHWDELVPAHARSAFYDVESFRAGRTTLMPLERKELGDVGGKSMLHLQCHFGLDTISWARLGARVTGADFSPQAIRLARSLSAELDVSARFVCADLYELPGVLDELFDIVFTSYGVLSWLPDLARWGQVIAHFLRPDGIFYIAEIHPFACIFSDQVDTPNLQIHYPYFSSGEPLRFDESGSYATPDTQLEHTTMYEWPYPIGDIVSALVAAGLQIDFLHEFPYASYQMFPLLEQDEDGWWWLPGQKSLIPMTFSLQAHKAP